MDNYPESDWKLFRVKIVEWQENYIKRTNEKLVKILTDGKLSSADRFWKVEKMTQNFERTAYMTLYYKKTFLRKNQPCT